MTSTACPTARDSSNWSGQAGHLIGQEIPSPARWNSDISALTDLLAESHDLEPSAVAAMPTMAGRNGDMNLWILEQDGVAVSIATYRVADSVSVWAMGTTERFGRRGYGRALLAHVL